MNFLPPSRNPRHRTSFLGRVVRLAAGLLACSLASGFLAVAASAQYTAVSPPESGGVPDQKVLRGNIEEARWTAGPFRLQPWLGLRDVSYVSSQQSASEDEEQDNDGQLTVTAGAGLRAYAPVGSKVVWASHLMPEYVWWQDDESKDGLAGRYGMGFFGYANRLEFQLSHRLVEQQRFFSDEVQELTLVSTATSSVGVDAEILRGVHVYGGWQRIEFEGNSDDDQVFTQLDRVEDGWNAGVRLVSRRGWSVGVGTRQLDAEFDETARDLSFEAEAILFDVQAEIRKVTASLELEEIEYTPREGSELAPVEVTLGDLRLTFQPRERYGFELYGQRRQDYSVRETRSLLFTEEQGLRLLLHRRRLGLTLMAGTGTVEAEGVAGIASVAATDYDTWGAQLSWSISRFGSLRLNVLNRDYDDSPTGLARDDVTSYGLSVQLGELAQRLSIGDSRSDW